MLEKAGHTVVGESVNGQQAIADYARYKPDLVTLDITMPGLNGIETIKRIVADDPDAVVIMVSALGQKHMVFDALQAGAKNYILKPLNEERLLGVISTVLQQSGGSLPAAGAR